MRRSSLRSAVSAGRRGRPHVTDDVNIWRAARLLVDRHGNDAAPRAAQRANDLLVEGNLEGSAVWRRILVAIKELRRRPREGDVIH